MKATFSILSDAMLWFTIPLMGRMAIWEHGLAISDANHKLVQVINVLVAFGWVYLWYRLGEQSRFLSRLSVKRAEPRKYYYYRRVMLHPEDSIWTAGYASQNLTSLQDWSKEPIER